MNFLCDRCKQKYHVADEKVRGRAVTRFKCKKCEHVIELRVTSADGMPSNALPDDANATDESPASIPPPSVAPRTAAGPAAAPRPAASTSAPRPASSTGIPAAPRSPTGIGMSAASPRPSTNALPSLGNRPAAGALPSRPSNPPPGAPKRASLPPSPLLAGAPRAATSNALPTAAARSASAPRPATSSALPAARPASPSSASPLRTGLATKEPERRTTSAASALLNANETGWYAGVRDLPVGPITRSELAAKIEAGDITPDSLVWREGLDDWRPLRNVEELSDLVRVASQKMSDGLLGTMGRREPAAAAKVVPIAQGRPGAKHEDSGGFGADDDEPTRMTALGDLIATAEDRGLLPPAAGANRPAAGSKPAMAAVSPAGSPRATASAPPAATASAPPAPAATASAPPVATASAPLAPATKSALPSATATAPFALMSPPAPAVAPTPAPTAASFAGPNEPTFNIDPATVGLGPTVAATPAPTATASAAPAQASEQRRGGIPIGIWILMVGVLVTGIAVGVVVRPSGNAPATTNASTTPAPPVAVHPAEPTTRQVGAQIQLPAEAPPQPAQPAVVPAAPVAPVAPTVAAAADTTHHVTPRVAAPNPGSTGTPNANGSHAAGSTLSAAQLAALNAQLGAQGSGIAQSTGPTNTALRTAPQAAETGGGLTGEARAGQVINTFRRANVVDSCWTAAQRRNPAHPSEAIRVGIDVGPTGRATGVRVTGANDPDLVNCISTRTRAQPYGAGGNVSTEVSFNLVPGQ